MGCSRTIALFTGLFTGVQAHLTLTVFLRSHHAPAAARYWSAGRLQLHCLLPHRGLLHRTGLHALLLHPARARASAHASRRRPWRLLLRRCSPQSGELTFEKSCGDLLGTLIGQHGSAVLVVAIAWME